MAGRIKSEWKVKLDDLKSQLPEKFDARSFAGYPRKGNGTFADDTLSAFCEKKGFKGKEKAIQDYLAHQHNKPAPEPRAKKPTKTTIPQEQVLVNLKSKKTYKGLSALEIGEVITMLTEIQKERKESDIAKLKAEREVIDKQLKELQGK
jgi:flagellar basal body L-ring protein FlgH